MSRAATDKPRRLAAIAAGLALFAGLLQPTLAQDGIERAGYFEVRSASTRQVGALDCSSYYWRDVTVFLVYSTMFILVSRSMYQNNNTSLCV